MRTAIEGEHYLGKWHTQIDEQPNYRQVYFTLSVLFIGLIALLWGMHMGHKYGFTSLIIL
jgi:hypothetical protein